MTEFHDLRELDTDTLRDIVTQSGVIWPMAATESRGCSAFGCAALQPRRSVAGTLRVAGSMKRWRRCLETTMDKPEPLSDDILARAERDELVQKVYELESERDALRADAERYRHLRDSGDTSIYAMRFDIEGDTPVDGPDLDASIDAARAAQERPKC